MASNPYIYTKLPNGQVVRLARGGSASGGVSGGGGTGNTNMVQNLAQKPTGGTASTPTIIASLPAATTTAVDNLVKQAANNQKPIATTTPSSSTTTTSTPSTTTTGTSATTTGTSGATAATPYDTLRDEVKGILEANAEGELSAAKQRYADAKAETLANDEAWKAGQSELRDAYLQRAKEAQELERAASDWQYDRNARQNYINYMQAQKQLPSQLNSLGIRGGAAESSLVRLGSNYGTNVANNEIARAQALDSISNRYSEQINDYEMAYKQALLARDDATATTLAQMLNSMNETLANITAAKNEAIVNATMNLTSSGIEWSQNKEERAEEMSRWLQQFNREGLWHDEDWARTGQWHDEEVASDKEKTAYQREQDAYAKEQDEYEKEKYAGEYKDAQAQKMLEQWAAGLTQYQSVGTLETIIKNIKKNHPDWETDPYYFGQVQAAKARIGEIKAAKK